MMKIEVKWRVCFMQENVLRNTFAKFNKATILHYSYDQFDFYIIFFLYSNKKKPQNHRFLIQNLKALHLIISWNKYLECNCCINYYYDKNIINENIKIASCIK